MSRLKLNPEEIFIVAGTERYGCDVCTLDLDESNGRLAESLAEFHLKASARSQYGGLGWRIAKVMFLGGMVT